jgi:hypothetical protein
VAWLQRPFSEYDSNYQIMFVVGMGGRPEPPEGLSREGRDFCLSCLTHAPEDRPRADQLAAHHFLMVPTAYAAFFIHGKHINVFTSTAFPKKQTLKEAEWGYVGLLGL